MHVCQKAIDIPPFLVMEILERAQELEREGRKIIHLEVGEPDFDTPAVIRQAAASALEAGQTHYTHSMGDLRLREATAAYYDRQYRLSIDPARIIITSGTSPAMLVLFAAILEAGDEVIMADPHYACYPNFVSYMAGGVPTYVTTVEEDGFQLGVEAVKEAITPRTKAILINSPANPTGQLLSDERMARLAELGPMVVSDEIYHGLVYEGRARSILEFTDRAVVLNGFSKLWAMTGWRLGWLILPPDMVRPLQKMCQSFFISVNAFCQAAGVVALSQADGEVAEMVSRYDARRRLMVARLKELGLGIKVEPTGAFYVLANAKHLDHDSSRLAFDILEKAQVGVAPGIDFGQAAEGYLRFSYASSRANIEQAMDRLGAYLKARGAGS
ncbi:MAG: pyridoxal phosphate-dependent aminotransferase [Deltaproteobacteria bacterium]|nr:pyridoxal phosphate-dependent aminotransferase [Deltaproteobacteria bacterium]